MKVTSQRRSRHSLALGTAVVAVTALTLSGCSAANTDASSTTATNSTGWVTTTPAATGSLDTVDWNAAPEPDILDPVLSDNYGQNEILSNVCQSLQTFDDNSNVIAGLATATPSADHHTVVYDINPKAVFSDGKPVTSADVVYSLTRSQDSSASLGSYWSAYFANVTSIKATSDTQVTITLSQADLLFEKVMATTAGTIVEKSAAEKAGSAFGTASGLPVCSGPYKFESWNQGSDLTITASSNFWGDTKPLTTTVVFHFLMGDATQSTALSSGQLKGMYTAPPAALATLQKSGNVYYGASSTTMSIAPTQKDGPLQNAKIRKALYLALDRAALAATAFSGAAVAAQSVLSPWTYGTISHTTDSGTGGSADELQKATDLVKEAGYDGSEIIIAGYTGISEAANSSVEAFVEAGKSIGLNISFKSITLAEMYGLFGGKDGWKATNADGFPTQNYAIVADPMAVFTSWTPGSITNYGGYDNAEFQKLFSEASVATDETTRNDLISQIDSLLSDELPWIPLVNVANVLYMDSSVTGAPPSFTSNFYTPWAARLGSSS